MLTVIIATHNGSERLPVTLESLTRLQSPEGGWQLVVVENGSTDGTLDVLESFASRLPLEIRTRAEPAKAAALNAVIPLTAGDLVVFTDDDVVVDPEWLIHFRRAADEHDEFDVFGGAILPLWPTPPPDWISRLVPVGPTYALTAPDLEDGPVHPGLVWGPSMAVRRRVFDRGHFFDERFGPQPGQFRMGDETEFTTRVAGLGHRSWFVKDARVQHVIRANQMDPDWVILRAYRLGRDHFWKQNDPALRLESQAPPRHPSWWGIPRWVYRRLLDNALKGFTTSRRRDFDGWFRARYDYNYWRGMIAEALSREGRTLLREVRRGEVGV